MITLVSKIFGVASTFDFPPPTDASFLEKFKEFLNNVSDDAMLYARNGGIAMANDEDFWAINCLTEMDYRCDYSCCAGEECYDDLYMDY